MKCATLLIALLCIPLCMQSQERRFSIYFEHDEFTLTPKQLALIDSLNQLPDKHLLDVHIKGYTNNIGTERYNLKLSSQRAETVKSYLRQFTIISSIGLGELETDGASDRRVDVFVHRKIDHIPEPDEVVEPPRDPPEPTQRWRDYSNLKAGDKLVLQDIRFYADRDVIMNESKRALEEFIVFLKENPKVRFRLIGHICCGDPENPGRDLKNVRTGQRNLSEARAQSLRNYLVKKGIDKKRIRYIGMAYTNPTGKGDAFDRRVEIEIISLD